MTDTDELRAVIRAAEIAVGEGDLETAEAAGEKFLGQVRKAKQEVDR